MKKLITVVTQIFVWLVFWPVLLASLAEDYTIDTLSSNENDLCMSVGVIVEGFYILFLFLGLFALLGILTCAS